jgi:hypothetical protein
MFEDVKHGHGGATGGRERSSGQRRADGWNSGPAPGYVSGIERKIEADDVFCSAFGEHLKEEAASAADVEHQARFFRFAQGALHETKMVAQDEAAVNLLENVGGVGVRGVPVTGRIIIAQLQRMRLRIEPDEAAVAAFDDAENFVRRSVEAVGAGKKQAGIAMAAGGARVRSGDGTRCSGLNYVAFSDSSRRGIR